MRALGVLVRVELLRLLRTREVHLFLLLPALLGVPLVAAIALVVSSWAGGSVAVAVPADLPAHLHLHESLVQEQVRVVVTEDPGEAYAQGRVDVAVLGWLEGDGVGGRAGTAYETRFVAVGHQERAREALRGAVRRTNRKHVEERMVATGADPELFHLWWSTVPVEGPSGPGGRFHAAVAAYLAFLLGLVSYQVVPIGVVSDRLEGIAEAFGATPAPRTALLLSRLIAVTAVELLALGLLLVSAWALLSSLADVPLPTPEALARAVAALALINALYLLPGVRARSAREALNLSSVTLLATGALLGGGLMGLPAWVPLAGVASAAAGPEGWVAVGATGLAAVVVLALAVALTSADSLLPPSQSR